MDCKNILINIMKNYHYTETRQKWLKENKDKLRAYIRDYMRNRRYTMKGNIKIENKNITLFFNYILY